MRFFHVILISAATVCIVSCSSFVLDTDFASVRELESNTYILQKDVLNNRQVVMAKGKSVKIFVKSDTTWVKVYAYPSEEDILTSKRSLVLYIFDDEFPDKLFKRDYFDRKFAEYFAKENPADAGKVKSKGKNSGRK
ncbi:MAG TPA: hypothetical protein PKK43_03265 [Spirochaetota bacterium]|nr:hypothetical protein [Spirochaetota bacterium]